MNIKRPTWIIFTVAALVSLLLWWRFSYPQLAFTNFTINRTKALSLATSYLENELGIDTSRYHKAIVFQADEVANRFLQRTIGFDGLVRFCQEHDFDMFYWIARYFQKGEKEGYYVFISSANGEVIAFRHVLEDTHPIDRIEREEARRRTEQFLNERFRFNPDEYTIKGDLLHHFDFRSDYSFSWIKKSAVITWGPGPEAGFGKLVTGAKISGDQVLSFTKGALSVPDEFERQIERLKNTGNNLSTIIRIFTTLLFLATIYFVLARRNHLAMHTTKKFYIGIMLASFGLTLMSSINQLQSILFEYNTNSPLFDYLFRVVIDTAFQGLFISVALLMPGLSGELLHYEEFPDKKEGTFLYYLRTTFFSRHMFQLIILGYLTCIIMLGMQSVLVEIGQRYWGVWREYSWIIQLTTSYVPLLAAFTIAFKASFMEELMYRLFAISLGKKLFKGILAAVIASSLMWGFAHSSYAVFPMWFRGVEVTCLGLLLSFIYLRFGIIPVIVAHYLFDIFWNMSGYLLGHTNPIYFMNALSVLLLPLLLGVIAWVMNKTEKEKPLQWYLNEHQKYNLQILTLYLKENWEEFRMKSKEEIRKEIASHNWDIAVVEVALDRLMGEKAKN